MLDVGRECATNRTHFFRQWMFIAIWRKLIFIKTVAFPLTDNVSCAVIDIESRLLEPGPALEVAGPN